MVEWAVELGDGKKEWMCMNIVVKKKVGKQENVLINTVLYIFLKDCLIVCISKVLPHVLVD